MFGESLCNHISYKREISSRYCEIRKLVFPLSIHPERNSFPGSMLLQRRASKIMLKHLRLITKSSIATYSLYVFNSRVDNLQKTHTPDTQTQSIPVNAHPGRHKHIDVFMPHKSISFEPYCIFPVHYVFFLYRPHLFLNSFYNSSHFSLIDWLTRFTVLSCSWLHSVPGSARLSVAALFFFFFF